MTMMGFSQRSSMVLGTSEVLGADLGSSDENHRSKSGLRVLLSNWGPLVIYIYISGVKPGKESGVSETGFFFKDFVM
jgi:hypothetical protein